MADDYRMDFLEEAIQTVLKNFYADDCLKSVILLREPLTLSIVLNCLLL